MDKETRFQDILDFLHGYIEDHQLTDKVNGMDFLIEYFEANPPDDMQEGLEQQEASKIIKDLESWLRKSHTDLLEVGKHHVWPLAGMEERTTPTPEMIPTGEEVAGLTDEEDQLLRKDGSEISFDDFEKLQILDSRVRSLSDKSLEAECALRLAWSVDDPDCKFTPHQKAGYWESAAAKCKSANKKNYYKWFKKAAEMYQIQSVHYKAAQCFKSAAEGISESKAGSKERLEVDMLRQSRVQYALDGNSELASAMFVRENNAELALAKNSKKFVLFASKILSSYGESPRRVLLWIIGIWLANAFIYYWIGIQPSSPGSDVVYKDVGSSLYYSIVTFTTLGYGDFSPASGWGRFFSGLEAFSGLFFSSLLIVTVVRRFTR